MVFNSHSFLLFFGIVLAVYFSKISWNAKKIFLLFASYLFYAAWNPPFVLLLYFSTVFDWKVGQLIHAAPSWRLRKFYLAVSLVSNLGLLAFFKYATFFAQASADILSMIGVMYQPPGWNIILPVGISFYTFQTLSYSIDIYRKHIRPWHSFTDYALFVSFFPQLVAGPIVRASDFLPQTISERKVPPRLLGWGLSLMVLGLFQKVVLADTLLAPVVERVYDSIGVVSPLAAGIGTLAFAGQIFCDFAGYSTTAIGAAMCLGFALPDNFRFPYAAIGFSDFWQRWHISLSSWLRDYLYISMGGNRRGRARTYRNLMVTMLLGGLWHGASWNFVVWGGLHGLYLVAERGARKLTGSWNVWRTRIGRVFLGGVTFGLVCMAWVFFRAPDLAKAFEIVRAGVFFLPRPESQIFIRQAESIVVIGIISVLLLLHSLLRNATVEQAVARIPPGILGFGLAVMLVCIAISPGEDRAFIYFQF